MKLPDVITQAIVRISGGGVMAVGLLQLDHHGWR